MKAKKFINFRSTFLLFAIFSNLIISGCAIPMRVQLKEHEAHFQSMGIEDKGLIYFYRESEWVGSGRGIYIMANGKRVGALNSGTYFVYIADPGENVFEAENALGDNPRRIIDVKAGEKYYIRAAIKSGLWDALPRIEIVHKVEGSNAIQELNYATLE